MSAPDINDRDIAAVEEVRRSGRLSLGPRQEEFERLFAEYCGVKRYGLVLLSAAHREFGGPALHRDVKLTVDTRNVVGSE